MKRRERRVGNEKKELEFIQQELMAINDQLDRLEVEKEGLERIRDDLVNRHHTLKNWKVGAGEYNKKEENNAATN